MTMKNSLIIILAGLLFFSTGCDRSEYDLPDPDGRLNSLKVEFKHVSPRTGETVINGFSDKYRANETVNIEITTNYAIDRIEIANGQTLTALTTMQLNGATTASYSVPVSSLSVPFGQRVPLLFHLFFADQGKEGFDFPSIKSYAFNVVDDIPSVVNFKRADGSNVELAAIDNNIVGYANDPVRGVFVTTKPGVNSYLEVNNSLLNFGINSFSVSFWIQSEHDTSDPAIMGTMDWNSSNNPGWVLAWLNGRIRAVAGDGAGTKVDFRTDAAYSVLGPDWKFVTVVFNRTGNAVIYIDAVSRASAAMVGVDINNGVSVKINQDGTGTYGDKLGAKYASINFYNYALSDAQVAQIYNSSKVVNGF
jgi:hypothetical protein